jgi:glutamate dehydrogenase/leucine dehydrogenase
MAVVEDPVSARHRRDLAVSVTGSSLPQGEKPSIRAAATWGVVVGAIQAASPLGFWWLDPATVYAVGLAVIAAVYIGFAVADGRWRVIALECSVAMAFVVIAAAGITGSAWLLVLGFAAHGLKDAWQQRARYVSGTRWWPPFCAAVDWVVALVIGIEIVAGIHFQP